MKLFTIIIVITQLFSNILISQEIKESALDTEINKTKNNQVFIENKGQWDNEVLYLTKVNSANVWITKTGVVYDYYQIEKTADDKIQNQQLNRTNSHKPDLENEPKYNIKGHIIKMEFNNSNSNPTPTSSYKSKTYHNYFLGIDKSKWASNVSLYNEVQVNNIYEDISVKYYFDGNSIRYDYILEAGADISKLKMNYKGQNNIETNNEGELLITTSLCEIKHNKIFAYQELNNQKIEIECRFEKTSDNQYTFKLGKYDKTLALIIDPLVWSTLIGGSVKSGGSFDFVRGMAVDEVGNVYIANKALNEDYPTTTGAYDETQNGKIDVAISKLSDDGSTLVYSTFIGGSSDDEVKGIVIDQSNNVYVTGMTGGNNDDENDFPTTSGAFDEAYNGNSDVFVSKLSSDGSKLFYSTYIGGQYSEYGHAITLDDSNNAYIAGITISDQNTNDYPTTAGAYDETFNGGYYDIIVSKLSSDGSEILYSTFIGGDGEDYAFGITIDKLNNIYIVGGTYIEGGGPTNYPTTSGAYDRFNHDWEDIIVSKLSNDGSTLLMSTIIGGESNERANGIALDDSNNVIITGYTNSKDYPATKGTYDDIMNELYIYDVFVSKLSNDGSALAWSTFIGGKYNDFANGIVLDKSNNIYIAGETVGNIGNETYTYPTTENAYDRTHNDNIDVMVSKLSSDGSTLLYSTYIGGNGNDKCYGIALDKSEKVYITGLTSSKHIPFPTTSGAYNEVHSNSVFDVFVTKFDKLATGILENNSINSNINIIYKGNDIFANYKSQAANDELKIYTLNGVLVETETLKNKVGQNRISLNANKLESGTYLVQIKSGEELNSGKFIVAK